MTTVVRKRGEREVNILAGMRHAEVDFPTPDETRLLAIAPDTPLLRVKIDLNEGAHVRTDELALALMEASERPRGYISARTGLWGIHKGVVHELLDPPVVSTAHLQAKPKEAATAPTA